MNCLNCDTEILSENINASTDVVFCANCKTVTKLSDYLTVDVNFDIKNNPKGTWYRRINSNELILGASTASPLAFFLIPFMLVWSGFSLGGIYGTQIISGEFDLFMSLFGIPFLIGTVIFGTIAIMSVAGKVEISITKQEGKIFTGIGKLGYTKTFFWKDVTKIEEQVFLGYKSRNPGTKIVIETNKKISFGSRLKENRKYYLLNSLKSVYQNIKNNNTLSF